MFLNAVKSTPKTRPNDRGSEQSLYPPPFDHLFVFFVLRFLFVLVLAFLSSLPTFCNFLSGGFAGRVESFPSWRYVLTCFGMSSPPSKGDASRALIPAVKKACCVGWLAMPCRSSGTRGLTNDGGSCGKPDPVIFFVIFLRAKSVF